MKSMFVDELATTTVEKLAASKLWDLLVDAAMIGDFRPLPDDDFHGMYGLAEEDLDEDIIIRIMTDLGLSVPERHVVEEFGEIKSPRDLIGLIALAGASASER